MRVAKLFYDAVLPTVNHQGDAGIDFYSLYDYVIKPNTSKICRTGIAVEIPTGVVGQLWAKSRNNWIVGAGIIDSTFQGEILFKIFNPTDHDIVISKGTALGQMVLVFCFPAYVEQVSIDEIFKVKTARGSTGGIVTEMTNEDS